MGYFQASFFILGYFRVFQGLLDINTLGYFRVFQRILDIFRDSEPNISLISLKGYPIPSHVWDILAQLPGRSIEVL